MRLPARSIRRDLVTWLAVGLLAVIAIAAIATYLRAREEANALFDYQLQQMAASITGMPLAGPSLDGTPGGNALVVQVWDRNGVQIFLSQPQASLPRHAQLGYNTVSTGTGEWRVFSTLAGEQVVQVAQPLSVRRELAASMALRTITPLLALVPVLAVLVWFGIARGLRPLQRVAAALSVRSPRALEPLAEAGLPVEIRPLVHALNGLLERLDRALSLQRAFIADAAHELRTPLTAVHLQAQLAEHAQSDAERARALADLRAGLGRATHLVEQLLALAREEPGVSERSFAPVNLTELTHHVIAEHAAGAAARGVDLGTVEPDGSTPDVIVNGDAAALRVMLSNLVDNAVRYAPDDGRVDVAVRRERGAVILEVRDNGPGIPSAERARVFDRFYRVARPGAADVPGSGLGLAIVKRIAERHDAEITLEPGIPGPLGEGLAIGVRFPVDFAAESTP